MLVAIVLGIVVRNVVHLPASVEPGLAFAAKRVLLGLQLVVGDILALGTGMVLVVVCVVSGGICSTLLIGRWMGISSTQRLLIAGGFSICGAAAVAAVDGVIETEDEEEVVTAVALVVLFGTLAIPLLPLAAGSLGMDPVRTGLWAGASVHEVAQVVAIGAGIGPAALKAAVIVKLARVLLLAPVMAVISVVRRRTAPLSARGHRPPVVPLFVAGFVAMVALRSRSEGGPDRGTVGRHVRTRVRGAPVDVPARGSPPTGARHGIHGRGGDHRPGGRDTGRLRAPHAPGAGDGWRCAGVGTRGSGVHCTQCHGNPGSRVERRASRPRPSNLNRTIPA